jgi:hypothetical protein
MVTDPDITITFTAADRHELIGALCDTLCEVLAPDATPEQAGALVPWQVTADTFEALPGRMIDTVLEELAASGGQLASVEFNGYLETDEGPRAWGFIGLVEGGAATHGLEHDQPVVVPLESGYRITWRVHRERTDDR